jgi:hypothetical protein
MQRRRSRRGVRRALRGVDVAPEAPGRPSRGAFEPPGRGERQRAPQGGRRAHLDELTPDGATPGRGQHHRARRRSPGRRQHRPQSASPRRSTSSDASGRARGGGAGRGGAARAVVAALRDRGCDRARPQPLGRARARRSWPPRRRRRRGPRRPRTSLPAVRVGRLLVRPPPSAWRAGRRVAAAGGGAAARRRGDRPRLPAAASRRCWRPRRGGLPVQNGLPMLVWQGAAAFEAWTGWKRRPTRWGAPRRRRSAGPGAGGRAQRGPSAPPS